MNWKIIFALSGFGLFMSIATVYFIPSNIEIFVWLAIFGFCAWVVQKYSGNNFFWHGFLISIINCIWMTSGHLILISDYIAHHKEQKDQFDQMVVQIKWTIPQILLVTGIIYGLLSGLFLGLLCNIAGKLFGKL